MAAEIEEAVVQADRRDAQQLLPDRGERLFLRAGGATYGVGSAGRAWRVVATSGRGAGSGAAIRTGPLFFVPLSIPLSIQYRRRSNG